MPNAPAEDPARDSLSDVAVPVREIPGDPKDAKLDPRPALCLSGGGYRAMLFHVGAIWRLHETGLLHRLGRVSSVSGGSLTAAVLALNWARITAMGAGRAELERELVTPLRGLAGETIDAEAIVLGGVLPGRISDRIAAAYDEHLFHGATLQDLPDEPRFVINATNVQSGALWRFMKPYMADYRVGIVDKPDVPLADAVAASSAFPPVLSPFELRLDPARFRTPSEGHDLQDGLFRRKVILTDGGVYDNLGLETAWKVHQTIFVSDGDGKMEPEEEPKSDWARHSYRVLNLIDNQVRSLRKRQVITSFKTQAGQRHHRTGAYWGIRSDIADYHLEDALDCPHDRTMELAATRTRLKRMDAGLQQRLINWGYAVCDAALRKHVDPKLARPKGFPYPGGV